MQRGRHLATFFHLRQAISVHRTQAEHENWNASQPILREVFASHRLFRGNDVRVAQHSSKDGNDSFDECFVIARGWRGIREFDRRFWSSGTRRSRLGLAL